jgi:flagellar hook-basal body complex protein FliE
MTISALGAIGALTPVGASGLLRPADPIAPTLFSGGEATGGGAAATGITAPGATELAAAGIGVSGAGGGAATALSAASNADQVSGSAQSFAAQLANSLQNLQNTYARKDQLAIQAATGNLTDVHDYTIAATEAALATQLTVAVRDKAVAAFQEILRMQG